MNEIQPKKNTWGGRREGSGRHKVAEKRKRRPLNFFEHEWVLIRQRAQDHNMCPREYLFWLVEKDDELTFNN